MDVPQSIATRKRRALRAKPNPHAKITGIYQHGNIFWPPSLQLPRHSTGDEDGSDYRKVANSLTTAAAALLLSFMNRPPPAEVDLFLREIRLISCAEMQQLFRIIKSIGKSFSGSPGAISLSAKATSRKAGSPDRKPE